MARYAKILVTPSMARQWLDKNAEENRPEKRSKVPSYARDMLAGKWREDTAEFIKFDDELDDGGILIDGANRMRAVILAGIPVWFDVAFGVPRENMVVLDTGAPHSAADAMRTGAPGATSLARSASIVRWAMMWDAKYYMGSGGGLRPTHSEIIDRYNAERGMFNAAATRATDCQNRGLATGAPMGVAYYLFANIDQEKAHGFFDQCVSGANLPHLSPVLTLRNRMLRARIDRLTRPEQLALTIRAWNAFREDRQIAQLLIVTGRDGKLNNENFPLPK